MNSPTNPIYRNAIAELGTVFERIDDAKVDAAVEAIAGAGTTVVFGGGRERLQIMGFAMRLYHMGVPVAVEGDMTTPPVGSGDLFLLTVGPGEISTAVALIDVAKKAGAKVLAITAQPEGRAARMADEVLLLPAQTMADDQGTARSSVLPMGSLYEGALFVLFEVMILKLRDRLNVTPEAMRARHTNLE
ncbi:MULTISPECIES: SIS domain-containing protein [unclassified Aureimonas]|uniref:SIS domain-containing protein n=1 Tax=unclassified Aureimonas TaxID=2615206 RepID=UPI0006F785E9|nr:MULTISPECIES: SIS domain-containing protein [unclassified Aureimonas]KQT64013.1 Fe-S cluster assembly protein HesB [Aureimonas sp. Leaf427]KQT81206.1 Fe-S cluster assembly protein HesB [Aureimonas sp. Leaf460]